MFITHATDPEISKLLCSLSEINHRIGDPELDIVIGLLKNRLSTPLEVEINLKKPDDKHVPWEGHVIKINKTGIKYN